jgi:recombination protein RecT
MENNTNMPVQGSKTNVLKNVLTEGEIGQQIKNALKDNSDAFVASVIDLYNSETRLQECNPNQVAAEALKAAVLKLPINKALGFAYLVPYKTGGKMVPQFQLGYKGYIQLAMRTAQYKHINADVVYEGELKTVDKLSGEIDFAGNRTSDKIVGYFAYIEMLNGFSKTLYMTREQMLSHAKRFSKSFAFDNSPWKTDFDSMGKKTVVRNLLSHYGYLSVEMIAAIDRDVDDVEYRNNEIQSRANTETLQVDDVPYEEVVDRAEPKIEPAF